MGGITAGTEARGFWFVHPRPFPRLQSGAIDTRMMHHVHGMSVLRSDGQQVRPIQQVPADGMPA